MNAQLKSSIEAAEGILSVDAQDQLVSLIQSFTLTQGLPLNHHFSRAEMHELKAEAKSPFVSADPKYIKEILKRNSVKIKHEL